MRRYRRRAIILGLLISGHVSAITFAATTFAEIKQDLPTLICLGVSCRVNNASGKQTAVQLSYRKQGTTTWTRGLDLIWVKENLYAGSVFDLGPNTGYDLRLKIAGTTTEKIITAKTRAIPTVAKVSRTLHVTPGSGGGSGTATDPFQGLTAAHAVARPGDIFILHKGVYSGTFTVSKSGIAVKPIVWRGAKDESVVLNAGGKVGVLADNTRHIIFENFTIQNASWGFIAHNGNDLTLRRLRIEKIADAVMIRGNRTLITDNTFIGKRPWPTGRTTEDLGVEVEGNGNVVCYNFITNFDDGIRTITRTGKGTNTNAVDFYNNEIVNSLDDSIELDWSHQNIRCFRNRITNALTGISVQPNYDGPAYIFRNVMYNIVDSVFKLHENPTGLQIFHNTAVKGGPVRERGVTLINYAKGTINNSRLRNNVFLGMPTGYVIEFSNKLAGVDWDYNGYAAGAFARFAKWNGVRYATFADFKTGTKMETRGVRINPQTVFASGLKLPENFKTAYLPRVVDVRLATITNALDAGEVLPNINDGFAGKAPDLGALEANQTVPHYGPRK